MEFKELYNQRILDRINAEAKKAPGSIFVILGQLNLVNNPVIINHATDLQRFYSLGNSQTFDQSWAKNVFLELQHETRDYHVLSYPQFCYLLTYFDKTLFGERIIIIKDNLRLLYPISKGEYIEQSEEEYGIEKRPDRLPVYQAEQVKIDNDYYYSLKMPEVEDFKIIDIFKDQLELEISADESLEIVDVSSDEYAIDQFINDCIKTGDFSKKAIVKIYKKQPISKEIEKIIPVINYLLNLFGGNLYEKHETNIQEDYQVNPKTEELLKNYWGPDATFRKLLVYKNPDINNQITEISQGLIVDSIIEEYNKTKRGEKARDLFLTAPTGAGKSLLFQLPSFFVSSNNDVTIVVSPLIALMKDQVNAIIQDREFEKVAYLNSELSLVDRDKIIENCKNGTIDILYMSPELLLSYPISNFIGERKLGLMVIDEAHLITTWGRDFRVDYWFLGNHIRKIRKYQKMNFPMVAVTATAIYGGANDMVFDSIDSLVMHNPHVFIGQVKREDITFLINNYEKFEDKYEKRKIKQTVKFIKDIEAVGLKTLVYTPYTKHIKQIIAELASKKLDIAVGYYGSLPADQKELSFRSFKSGQKKIMVSTKAFGMGVDISDIQLVYHHAPSGLLPDYVQEIGRVARKAEIKGFAALNYASQDQGFSNSLHGMSSIKEWQVREVLKKIIKTFSKNNKNRNLLLSVDDFGHIFENATDDLDQKVMTCLMMIEKDYLAKNRFNVLIARPKKLFVQVYARISDEHLSEFKKNYQYAFHFILSLDNGFNIIELNLDRLWSKDFNEISFPVLKYRFYNGSLFKSRGLELSPQLRMSFEITLEFITVYERLEDLFKAINAVFSNFEGSFFSEENFQNSLNQYLKNKALTKKVVRFVLSSYSKNTFAQGGSQDNSFLARRLVKSEYRYRVFSTMYLRNFSLILQRFNKLFSPTDETIVERFIPNKGSSAENYIRLGYFLDILELGTFEIKGGENQMVFIRLNDPEKIQRDSSNEKYKNSILLKTLDRHYLSNELFDHFFLRAFSNQERWNFIEDYFLGADVGDLFDKHKGDGTSNNLDIVGYLKENAEPLNVDAEEISTENKIHIFQPDPETFYKLDVLLTLETETGQQTMKISKWLVHDPVAFDKIRRQMGLKVDSEVFKILTSKLNANHYEYFKNSLGLNILIDFKGYDKLVKALIPYKNKPIDFYKWWCDNPEKVKLSFREKIELIDKVNMIKPSVLKKEHKKIIGK